MSTVNFYSASAYARAILMLEIEKEEKAKVISEILTVSEFESSKLSIEDLEKIPFSKITLNFLKVIFRQKKQKLIQKVAEILKKDFLAQNNITVIKVCSAKDLTEETEREIKSQIKSLLKTNVAIEKTVDENLIEGFTVLFGDYFFDLSKKSKIFKIKSCILKQ